MAGIHKHPNCQQYSWERLPVIYALECAGSFVCLLAWEPSCLHVCCILYTRGNYRDLNCLRCCNQFSSGYLYPFLAKFPILEKLLGVLKSLGSSELRNLALFAHIYLVVVRSCNTKGVALQGLSEDSYDSSACCCGSIFDMNPVKSFASA